MDRYIGLDAHSSSSTVAVVGPSGRRLQSKVLETNAGVLIDFLKSVPHPRHLCLEEGTHRVPRKSCNPTRIGNPNGPPTRLRPH